MHVASRFDAGILAVDSCYKCEFYNVPETGEQFGEPLCGTRIENITTIKTSACPMYANSGCYHAASFHLDYLTEQMDYEEDYRGCSSFHSVDGTGDDNRYFCHHMELNGLDHENCKSM